MSRITRVSLLAGGIIAGGVVTAVVASGASLPAIGGGPSAAAPATGQSVASAPVANRRAGSTSATRQTWSFGTSAPVSGTVPGPNGQGRWGGARGHGFGGGFGAFGPMGRGRGLVVTGVSGNTIKATGRGGQTITVQVSATTAYTEAGGSASLSDVKVGSIIAVKSSSAPTSGTTINASGITIVLPQLAGVVTNVNGSTLTVTGFDGSTRTVTLTGTTRYQKAGQSASASDVTSGTAIVAEGTRNSDGSLTAVRVTIQLPRLAGQVTAVNGSTITVSGRGGTSLSITTSGSTSYVNADGTSASASAVKKGVVVIAEGTLSSDGKTLAAQRVTVAPAGAGRGFGRHGGFGGFGRHGGPGGFGGFGTGGATRTTGGATTNAPSGTPSV